MEAAIIHEGTTPSWVDPTDWAEGFEEALRRLNEGEWRHNEEISESDRVADWVDPNIAETVRDNWEQALSTVPGLERLETSGQLSLIVASERPDLIDRSELHRVFFEMASYLLGDESEVETIHPRSRIRYRISAAELPGRRLAVAFAEAEETESEGTGIVSKQAFVYNPAETGGTFTCQEYFRAVETGSGPIRGEADPTVQRREFPADVIDLVSNLRVLAESSAVPAQQND